MLKTDASRKGIAGLLLQKQKGEWKIVQCCSRRLSSSELNYGITDLEGLAVIHALHKFRPYLLPGNLFTILWNFEIFFRASGTSPAGLGEFESKKSV